MDVLFIIISLVGYVRMQEAVSIRLVGGSRASKGRVEVFYDNEWGTVCDDGFGTDEARVVCRMLDFTGTSVTAYGESLYGAGSGRTWLDDVNCHGNESSLLECEKKPWGQEDCSHDEDVGVDCEPPTSLEADAIRLVDGTRQSNGRVEVLYDGEWGTICDDGFELNAAKVICRMLNFTGNSITFHGEGFYGQGSGIIWLDDIQCNGVETTVWQCRTKPWGQENCGHNEDVHIDCETPPNAIRLMRGGRASEGRVEIYHNNTWGTICDKHFDFNAAKVVCRMLNFTWDAVAFRSQSFYGEGSGPIWIEDIRCQGEETSLSQCMSKPWGQYNCSHRDDVGVDCETHLRVDIPVRFANGRSKHEGRVEIFHDNKWNTWCGAAFSMREAKVICKQRGFYDVQEILTTNETFGLGTGDILKNPFVCQGTEMHLAACSSYDGWMTTTSCNHSMDAGVICDPSTEKSQDAHASFHWSWFYALASYAFLVSTAFVIVTVILCRRVSHIHHKQDNRQHRGMEIATVNGTANVTTENIGRTAERYQSLLDRTSPPDSYETPIQPYEQCNGQQEDELYEAVD